MEEDNKGCLTIIVFALVLFGVLMFASCRESRRFQTITLRGHVTVNGERHEASWISYQHRGGYVRWRDMNGQWFTSYGSITVEGPDSNYSGD